MTENRKKIEDKNRKGYYVEIKKETLYFYGKLLVCILIIKSSNFIYGTGDNIVHIFDGQWKIDEDYERYRENQVIEIESKRGQEGCITSYWT